VYIPLLSIVPSVALPPAVEFTDQVTLVFVLPVTVAANDPVDPARIVAVAGVTVTLVVLVFSGGVVGVAPPPTVCEPTPAQPLNHNVRSTPSALEIRFTDVPPMDSTTVLHTTAAISVLQFAFLFQVCELGVAALGESRVENACGTGYWPRGQNWADELPVCADENEVFRSSMKIRDGGTIGASIRL
jgi:hypothetical protein